MMIQSFTIPSSPHFSSFFLPNLLFVFTEKIHTHTYIIMKNQFMNMMQWQAKGPQQQHHHHHHHDRYHDQEQVYGSDNNEYQLVKDGRPYGNIVFSCYDSGAFKLSEEEQMMTQSPARNHHLHHSRPPMQNHHHDHHQYAYNTSNMHTAAVVDDEDINDEAEEFIQMEHKKFNFLMNNNKPKRTWSSG